MSEPNAEELDQLRSLLSKLTGKDQACVIRSSKLKEDLGLDSLGMMELLFEAEDLFELSIEIPSDELAKIVTVGDLQDALNSKLV
jgi:acyl carrier protein